MSTVFGMHIGNTSACLAISKSEETSADRRIEILANATGDRVTPAIVTVTEDETVVGAACKSYLASRWKTTVLHNKLMFNKVNLDDIVSNGHKAPAMVMRGSELCYEMPLETGTVLKSVQEITVHIMHSLIGIAKQAIPNRNCDLSCVVMVPKHFSSDARLMIEVAAEIVGWNVLQVINEPAAAVLGYQLLCPLPDQIPKNRNIIVYRVGGKTCDVTLMAMNFGMLSVVDSEYSEAINGYKLVQTLTNFLANQFQSKYKLDPRESYRSLVKLTLAAENCMKVLSTVETANCFVESLCEGVDFSYSMSRARFESLLAPYLPKFAKPLVDLVSRSEEAQQNDCSGPFTLVLCGGPLKIPRLKKYISEEVISKSMIEEVVPLPTGVNYDEILACGAARQARLIMEHRLINDLPREMEIPTLGNAISVQVEGADCKSIKFEQGQPLPAHKTIVVNSGSDQITMSFSQPVFQHEFRGELKLEDVQYPMELQVEIDNLHEVSVQVSYPESEFGSTLRYPVTMETNLPQEIH